MAHLGTLALQHQQPLLGMRMELEMAVLGCSRFTVQALATEEEAPGPAAFPPHS